MRLAIPTSILLCLFATQFPGYNAGVVPATLKYRKVEHLNGTSWSVINDVNRRTAGNCCSGIRPGGGGGGDSGGGTGGGGGGTGGSGDGTSQTDDGQTGGLGSDQETEGGLGAPPAGGGGDGSSQFADNPPPPGFPPTVRNNYNKPAAEETSTYFPASADVIDLHAKVAEFKKSIATLAHPNGPWFFYSGFEDRRRAFDFAVPVSLKAAGMSDPSGMPSINELMPSAAHDPMLQKFQNGPNLDYFWASCSIAYAQAITGKVYVVIPEGRKINQPYNDRGSMWWTFEAPELTRNPYIDDITYIEIKDKLDDTDSLYNQPENRLGPPKIIWSRGDEALGTPASPYYKEIRPQESWDPDA